MPRGHQGTLTPSERINRFLRRIEALHSRRLLLDKLITSVNVREGPDGLHLTLGEMDQEDLRSFLVDFRVFISDNEPAFLDGQDRHCLPSAPHR